MIRKRVLFFLIVFFLALALYIFFYGNKYLWCFIFFSLSMLLFYLSSKLKKKISVVSCIFIASIIAAMSLYEGYYSSFIPPTYDYAPLSKSLYSSVTGTAPYGSNWHSDPILGYGPKPEAAKTVSQKTLNGKICYDVLYTTDNHGFRITPQRGDKADTAILFFGCSFTVGEGLNDSETYPYIVGEMLGDKYQVFNLGFHGYGSHQMLAEIESDRLDALLKRYKKVYAFYMNIDFHELRCSGLSPWDKDGPHYVLENNILEHRGKFSDFHKEKDSIADKLFGGSALYNRFFLAPGIKKQEKMLQLHVAILDKSKELLASKYKSSFAVILSPLVAHRSPLGDKIQTELAAHNINYINLENNIPDCKQQISKYIIQNDMHPNFLANQIAAKAIVDYIHQQK